jgi:hypothetical protein
VLLVAIMLLRLLDLVVPLLRIVGPRLGILPILLRVGLLLATMLPVAPVPIVGTTILVAVSHLISLVVASVSICLLGFVGRIVILLLRRTILVVVPNVPLPLATVIDRTLLLATHF